MEIPASVEPGMNDSTAAYITICGQECLVATKYQKYRDLVKLLQC